MSIARSLVAIVATLLFVSAGTPQAATPAVTGLSQSIAPLYGAPFVLTINGQNFSSDSQVSAGSTALATTFVSSSQLSAVVPTAVLSTPGTLQITVTDHGSVSNSIGLKVVERGDINGNRSVNIGDALVTALTVGGIIKPPLPIAVGDINLNGGANIGDALVLALFTGRVLANLATPAITSASPNSLTVGDTLTLTGTGFSTTASLNQVLFSTANDGVVRVTPATATSTVLTVTVPDNAVSGPIEVFRLDTPVGSGEFPLLVNNMATPLALTSVSPFFNVAPGSSVTLTGIGFDSTASNNAVLFRGSSGTVSATVIAATPTSLTVNVPNGALCGGVFVTVSGKSSNAKTAVISGTTCPLLLTDILGGGAAGDPIVLEGAGFDVSTPADNAVNFTTPDGSAAPAPVLQAGGTPLHVRIPDTAVTGNVSVKVGAQTSNALEYRLPSSAVPIAATLSIVPENLSVGVNQTGTLTVYLNPAPLSAGTIALAASSTSTISVPNSVSFTAGQTRAGFGVTGRAEGGATVTATLGTSTATAQVDVQVLLSGTFSMSSNLVRITNFDTTKAFGTGSRTVSSDIVRVTNQDTTKAFGTGSRSVFSDIVRVTNLDTSKAFGTGARTVSSDVVRITNLDTSKAFGLGSRSVFSDLVRVTNQDTTKAFGAGARTVFSDLLRIRSTVGGITMTLDSPIVGVQANPVPALSSISPNNGTAGSTITVTLTGTNFARSAGATSVFVSGSGITVSAITVSNQTSLTASFAISAGAATGARNVTIQTADGTSGAVTFTVN